MANPMPIFLFEIGIIFLDNVLNRNYYPFNAQDHDSSIGKVLIAAPDPGAKVNRKAVQQYPRLEARHHEGREVKCGH